MLIITTKQGREYQWHNGESKPLLPSIEAVEMVQADGDELVYIRQSFDGIPTRFMGRVTVWRGDMARFIAENL